MVLLVKRPHFQRAFCRRGHLEVGEDPRPIHWARVNTLQVVYLALVLWRILCIQSFLGVRLERKRQTACSPI